MNTIRQIKMILYRLKRDFGQPVNIIRMVSMAQDVQTGIITPVQRLVRVKRAVIIDAKLGRDFVYDLSFIAANKNFTYGGLFDTSTRAMVIDGFDLPRDFVPNLDDRCIHFNERYQFKNVASTVYNLGYIITMQRLESQLNENIEELSMRQIVTPGQEETHA